jgi:hypothetical protein
MYTFFHRKTDLKALISKFQIIGVTVLIDMTWNQRLVDYATSFSSLNLHIPLPWDVSLIGGHKRSETIF